MSDYDGTRSTIVNTSIVNTLRCLMKFPADFPFVNLRTLETIVVASEVERLMADTYRRRHPNGKVHKATA